eukprot:6444655-Amphidinium_carterae.1
MAFCEMEENVKISTTSDGNTLLSVSKIFEWCCAAQKHELMQNGKSQDAQREKRLKLLQQQKRDSK